jgi:SH3 domain-containing kinase-binding protein 1
VLHDYVAENEDELSIEEGDIITILKKEDEGWWEGEIDGRKGWFPSNFVEEIK